MSAKAKESVAILCRCIKSETLRPLDLTSFNLANNLLIRFGRILIVESVPQNSGYLHIHEERKRERGHNITVDFQTVCQSRLKNTLVNRDSSTHDVNIKHTYPDRGVRVANHPAASANQNALKHFRAKNKNQKVAGMFSLQAKAQQRSERLHS